MPRAKPTPASAPLQLSVDVLPMGVVMLDRAHRVRHANPVFGGLFSQAEALIGRPLSDVFDAAGVASIDTASGKVYQLAREDAETSFQLNIASRDGGWIGYLSDVSHVRLAAEQARLAQDVRAQLMHDAEIGFWRYDPDSDCYLFPSELSLGHGGAGEPIPRASLRNLQHRDDQTKDAEIIERLAREAGSAESEMRYLTAQGGWTHLRVLYRTGARMPSGRYEVFGVSLNVTPAATARDAANLSAKRLEEARGAAEAATRAKSDFLASVSHEIRTPMNGIVGVLNLLRQETLSDGAKLLLAEALGCADMLAGLINDVLDFSKIEAGKLELAPAPTDCAAVTEGVVSLLRPQADAKGLTLRSAIGAEVGWAMVDPLRLRQCLFNVVGNAVKFTETGGVAVRVFAAREGKLRFEVADTGIGVPKAARQRLFDRFEQGDSSATRRFGGTGLGLAISRQLARMMGGDLDYDSRDGEGSTFWFEIDAPTAEAASKAAGVSGEAAPLAGLRMLVVDDNRVNRLVGVKSLEALGAEADAAESGPAAVEAVELGGYDLVLMDINMPGMDGMEATRRIRGLAAPACDTPIVALTADVMRHQHASYFAAGMNGVVPKPFSPAQLLAEVMRLSARDDDRVASA